MKKRCMNISKAIFVQFLTFCGTIDCTLYHSITLKRRALYKDMRKYSNIKAKANGIFFLPNKSLQLMKNHFF